MLPGGGGGGVYPVIEWHHFSILSNSDLNLDPSDPPDLALVISSASEAPKLFTCVPRFHRCIIKVMIVIINNNKVEPPKEKPSPSNIWLKHLNRGTKAKQTI